MDYYHLASAIVVIYASIVPLYMAKRVFRLNKRFFIVSLSLGLGLFTHGLYHYWAYVGNGTVKIGFEFVSALFIFFLTVYYTYVRRGSKHGD